MYDNQRKAIRNALTTERRTMQRQRLLKKLWRLDQRESQKTTLPMAVPDLPTVRRARP